MLKYISIEMLEELDERQKEKLRELWQPKVGNKVVAYTSYREFISTYIVMCLHGGYSCADIGNSIHEKYKRSQLLPVLNIGDMIEILERKNEKYNINNLMVKLNTALSSDDCNAYGVRLFNSNKEYRSDNLVIALWQAVKSLL